MSINESEYRHNLNGIVRALKVIAGDNTASVQVYSSGNCILRTGISHTELLTVEQFAKRMDEAVESHYEAGR
jgi:hypothetical protein